MRNERVKWLLSRLLRAQLADRLCNAKESKRGELVFYHLHASFLFNSQGNETDLSLRLPTVPGMITLPSTKADEGRSLTTSLKIAMIRQLLKDERNTSLNVFHAISYLYEH